CVPPPRRRELGPRPGGRPHADHPRGEGGGASGRDPPYPHRRGPRACPHPQSRATRQMKRLVRDFNASARKLATPPHSRPATSSDSLIPITSRDISQAIIRTPSSRAREIISSSELTFACFIMDRSIFAPTPK